MNISRTISLSIRNMLVSKMRTALSSLGIIIGVLSVVVLLAIGQGAQNNILSNISSLGTNLLTVRPGSQNSGDVRNQRASNQKIFTLEHVDLISKMDHVKMIAPLVSTQKQLVYKSANTSASVYGITPAYASVNNITVTSGNFISETQNTNRDKVVVIGPTTATNLFDTEDPLGKTIRVGNTLFTVIGVTKSKGTSSGPGASSSADSAVYVPLTTAQISLLGSQYLSTISVMVDDEANMDSTKTAITDALLVAFKITDSTKATFTVSSQAEMLETLSSVTGTMKIFLGGIAAISLLVGGIGVMNILLVTVTERTKEIGIRKAIGAKSLDIIGQFLIESVLLTVMGGLLGIGLSYGIVAVVNFFLTSITASITSAQILLALSFSVGIGLFF